MNNPEIDPRSADAAQTIFEAFEQTRSRFPGNAFLCVPAGCPGGPVELTYDEAARSIEKIVGCYRRAGYGRGYHISLLMESRVDFFLHWLAINTIGATLVPIGAEQVEAEVKSLLQFGDVDLVVSLQNRLDLARNAARESNRLKVADVSHLGSLPNAESRPRSDGAAQGSAAIVFTSGSTGRPKGCMLSNEYFLTFGRWYRDLGGRCELQTGRERIITPLPPNHVNALAFSSMGAISTGGCVVQLDRFRSDTWWSTARETGATVMHYLGVMPTMLLKLPPSGDDRRHALRFGLGGGIRGPDHQAFEDRFGVSLIEAWAMTETGGAGTISTHVGPRHLGTGCIGRPSPRYSEARIVDDAGDPAACGVTGELVSRASGASPRKGYFSGYYRDPQSTDDAWRGGWLHSGDLAFQDAEGSIYFVGRRKQIIRRSGENISAAEVEAVLTTLPNVRQAAVVPVPDAIREEEVFACIVPSDDVELSSANAVAIVTQAAARLSYFKLPGYVAFVASLPTTATQKLRYGAIIEFAQQLIAESSPTLFDLRDQKRRMRVEAQRRGLTSI